MKIDNIFDLVTSDKSEAKMMQRKSAIMISIRRKKDDLGMNQSQFAEYAKTTQPKISNLLNGRLSKITIDWLLVVADRVGVDTHF